MAEEQNEQAPGATENQQEAPPLVIHGQYIKDLSFESPDAPAIFAKLVKEQPDVKVNVDVDAMKMTETQFEVIVKIRADCTMAEGETVAFIAELAYAGIFELNVPQEHLEPMLLIECPRLLFPFARHIIANTTRDGAFPPMMLNPVDFAAMYRARLEQVAQQQKTEGNA